MRERERERERERIWLHRSMDTGSQTARQTDGQTGTDTCKDG